MTWQEDKTKVVKNGKVKNIAIRHSEVKTTQSTLSNPIPAPRSREIQDYLTNPTPYLTRFSQLYTIVKSQPKWQSRDDYIKLIIKQTADKSIKDRDVRNFLDYIKEAEEDSKTQKSVTDTDLKEAKEMGYNAFFKEIYASAQDKLFLDKFMQNREVGDKDGMLLLKAWMDGNTKARLEEKPKYKPKYKIMYASVDLPTSNSSSRIFGIEHNGQVFGRVSAFAPTGVHDIKNFKQLPDEEYNTYKKWLKTDSKGKTIRDAQNMQWIEVHAEELIKQGIEKYNKQQEGQKEYERGQKLREEYNIKIEDISVGDRLELVFDHTLWTVTKKDSKDVYGKKDGSDTEVFIGGSIIDGYKLLKESNILNDFKTKIQNATQINELNELNINVVDAVADGKFNKAKVIPVDINALHGLIDEKMVDLFKIKIGDIKDFEIKLNEAVNKTSSPNKSGYISIMVSNELNRLTELKHKLIKSSLSQTKKDIVDILINSQKNQVRELKPKQDVKSLDEFGKIDYDALKSKTDIILLGIADITTTSQLDVVGTHIKKLTDSIGSTSDPKIQELIDNIVKLYNTKRRVMLGNDVVLKKVSEYEVKNLQYEAENKPPEMLPPKEYDDISKYTWGLTEADAIKKYTEKELKKNQSNIDFTNKQKAELEEMVKSKPHVLLTKAQIQKKYPPAEAEQMIRDLWTYKTKKSDYEKNADSSRFWQSKVDKINSGEWQKLNTNYLRDAYQKEVKDAIKKGKPVPYDVIKQYPEFTKSQNARERYDKGRHTSFANVSIAVDTRHQENHGIKIKLQDGSAMEDKYADEIIKTLTQYQSVVGDITPILKRENVTIAHTKYKHPFLSTAAGMYHPTDITVTMGRSGVGSHELTHFVDETAKKRHKDHPLYDYQLLAFAKTNMNGGIYAVERAIALSKSKSPQELENARELRFMLGTYWKRPEEIFARLMEQYTAYKNKGLTDTIYLHYPYEKYIKTPAYWDDVTFTGMIPQIESELKRKIELAGE